MHGQVLINSWIVLGLVIAFALVTTSELKPVPEGGQNLAEFVVEYIRDIAKTQIGEDYLTWTPFIGTLFLFIFVSNWSGALIPWKVIELPNGELGAPTNDINTTVIKSAGEIDVDKGTIVLNNFTPDAVTPIKITVLPNSLDLGPKRDQLISIDNSFVVITPEIDTIAVAGSAGSIDYTTTSRFK